MTLKRILVIPLRYIGDTVLSVPLLRALNRHLPEAKVDVLCSQIAGPLLETCPYVHRVLTEHRGIFKQLTVLQSDYDAVIVMRKSVSMALLCALAGIPLRIGYDKQRLPWGYQRSGYFLTQVTPYPSLKTNVYQAESHLNLIRALGIAETDTRLELWPTPEDERAIETLLTQHGLTGKTLAVVHAASASEGKSVDHASFQSAVEALLNKNFTVLFTGTLTDRNHIDALIQSLPAPKQLINLAGQTTLRQTVALFKKIALLLTVDSGPLHLGAAANVPKIVGVFGMTNEKQWGVYQPGVAFTPVFKDLPCRPFYPGSHDHRHCPQLTAEDIAQAVRQLLQAS